MLNELYLEPDIARGYDYSDIEILASIAELQQILTYGGFVLGDEVRHLHNGRPIEQRKPENKYMTWGEVLDFANQDGVTGLIHGAFNPPHAGHSHLARTVYPYCNRLLVGFDSNEAIRVRKGAGRPRFPQLAWRMWEMASLPTVDGVFLIPLAGKNSPEDYAEIYNDLRIRALGCDYDNPFRHQYEMRMAKVGGIVIAKNREPGLSSTTLMKYVNESISIQLLNISLTSLAEYLDKVASSLGYLRDYPVEKNRNYIW